jgi:hypothetical protein
LRVFLPTAFTSISEVQNAAFDGTIEKLRQHPGKIIRVRRRGKFVGYRIDVFVLLCAFDHGVDETWPVRTKHPRYPHNEMPIFGCKHLLFSGQL